jgi:hypothetical protein
MMYVPLQTTSNCSLYMKQMILTTQIQDTKILRVLHTIRRTTINPMDNNKILKKTTPETRTSSAIPEDALSPSRRNLACHQQEIHGVMSVLVMTLHKPGTYIIEKECLGRCGAMFSIINHHQGQRLH